MDELRLVEKLANGDLAVAEEAFGRISIRITSFLRHYLRTYLPREADREDAIVVVLSKIWEYRGRFELKSLGSWWAYVAKIARRTAMDQSDGDRSFELMADVPDEDYVLIQSAAEHSQMATELYRRADELWLGVPTEIDEQARERRLLAAQLHVAHGEDWQTTCELLSLSGPLQRRELDVWLEEESVIAQLAFNNLYFDNDALTCNLLGITPEELQLILSGNTKWLPRGWTEEEVKIAIWRFYNGLNREKIMQMAPYLSSAQVDKTVEKCLSLFPYESAAIRLRDALHEHRLNVSILSSPGLWKRLVFQYFAADELPQKQILERTELAAKVCGYTLTAGMLNVWLSNGRILEQLFKHVEDHK